MSKSFEVVVIGAGPGGYVAAIRCAQLGLNTACIDDWKGVQGKPSLGGTCLNVGCIPSKALLESSENFERMTHDFAAHGISADNASMDVQKMVKRKNKIVSDFTLGINQLFKKNKVDSLHGKAQLLGRDGDVWRVGIVDGEEVRAKHIIIATGSTSRILQQAPLDGVRIVDNVGALSFSETPKRLAIIGAGVIGLELGSVWRRLGAEVTILEASPVFLPAADEQVAKEALRAFTKQKLAIHLGAQVDGVTQAAETIKINWRDINGAAQELVADKLIVAVGRVPNTQSLNAESVGLKLDDAGRIEVDEQCRTSLPHVYAVGDVVRGPMLAHKASEEGVMVAELIGGQMGHTDLNLVPNVMYTAPEIAWVGKTVQQLKAEGVAYKAGQFPFLANGRARALGDTAGFIKILADANTDRVLGVHIVGPMASELIQQAVLAMAFSASSEDLARTVHAHPSLTEVMHEAALAVDMRAIHI
ncbi:dihydrolipoyl dehydrogenase [Candidatus Nitrotoga sp. M5]|uniref:dihydrolipoyl dehydrogenase n=1 Tax=Candidatus Nitrotoga sp. M5 TaxID=2890409 RepID=UPI001EF1C3CF|nr:dihydrolipoyl dehydrogenase [Candidatus Nitrotoga sp. M5]CAH1386727.1 2-oxoglutarate dehydrogenase, dihydrolipoamide dehydrogenase (E3) component [Candidatus Nitrotoga sp. M5]